jgi:hypothetical protein
MALFPNLHTSNGMFVIHVTATVIGVTREMVLAQVDHAHIDQFTSCFR